MLGVIERQNTKIKYLLTLTVAYFLVKNSAKDSLGEVSPKPHLLSGKVSKNRTRVRFLSDSTQRHIFWTLNLSLVIGAPYYKIGKQKISFLNTLPEKTFPKRILIRLPISYLGTPMGVGNGGRREGEGVFPLSAGSLETRGFKCVLWGAFFA